MLSWLYENKSLSEYELLLSFEMKMICQDSVRYCEYGYADEHPEYLSLVNARLLPRIMQKKIQTKVNQANLPQYLWV